MKAILLITLTLIAGNAAAQHPSNKVPSKVPYVRAPSTVPYEATAPGAVMYDRKTQKGTFDGGRKAYQVQGDTITTSDGRQAKCRDRGNKVICY